MISLRKPHICISKIHRRINGIGQDSGDVITEALELTAISFGFTSLTMWSSHCWSNGPLTRYGNYGWRMRRECRERSPRNCGLAIPTCITARAGCTCRDECRWSLTSGFLWSRWRGKRSRHSRWSATRNFAYLVRGLCQWSKREEDRWIHTKIKKCTESWRYSHDNTKQKAFLNYIHVLWNILHLHVRLSIVLAWFIEAFCSKSLINHVC